VDWCHPPSGTQETTSLAAIASVEAVGRASSVVEPYAGPLTPASPIGRPR